MVFETLVCSPLNHLTQLTARENFIILSRRERNKSHGRNITFVRTENIEIWRQKKLEKWNPAEMRFL